MIIFVHVYINIYIGIEFDGYYWHKDKAVKDKEKNYKCKTDGIKLYRIREGLPSLHDSSADYIIKKDHTDLAYIISELLREIVKLVIDVNLDRDAIEVENLREHTEKERSILSLKPELAKEWNYERNGELKPEYFSAGSNKKVWWKCSKGHEWQATINHRNTGCGCPICNSERKTSFPEYAIVYYLKKYGLEVIHSYREKGYELDVYMPSKKIAIEYDGYLWHKNKTKQDNLITYFGKEDFYKEFKTSISTIITPPIFFYKNNLEILISHIPILLENISF